MSDETKTNSGDGNAPRNFPLSSLVTHEMISGIVSNAVNEAYAVIEVRFSNMLASKISERIAPLQQSKIGELENQVAYLNAVLKEVSESAVGMFIVRKAMRTIDKKVNKSDKGIQQ